jgi:ABC-type Fe3+ transport system permease subunit
LLNLIFTMTASKALFMTSILTIITAIMAMVESHTMKKKEQGAYDKGKKGYRKRKKSEKAESSSLDALSPTACIICFIVSLLMWIMAPVSDYWYYGCMLVCIAVVFLTFVRIIHNYNILASRKLPQFDRTGGDDRA